MNARVESPFDACLKEALVLTAEWVPRWLAALSDTLQQRESEASHLHEKQGCTQARVLLETHRQLVGDRFLSMLTESLQGSSPQQGERPRAGRSLDSLSFDDLELVDHGQVQQTVEQARLQQVVRMAADDEFIAFNARLSRAQGLEVVRRQVRNPLDPDVVVGALVRTLGSLHLDEAVRNRWLNVGALPLGQELGTLYRRLSEQLERWGVPPAGFQVVQRSTRRNAAAQAENVLSASTIGSDAQLTLDHLHQLLVVHLDQVDAGSGSGHAMVRTLAAEVVALMLRRIHEDTRLLAPVRELVQGFKPALLQLARADPRFFADRHNPARRLLDLITTRGLRFTREQDGGFAAYAQELQSMVQTLQAPTASLPELFPGLLIGLAQNDVVTLAPAPGVAKLTLVKVEQRQLLAERVSTEMAARNDFARAPGVVRRFLSGPWSQVVAQARVSAAQQDGGRPPDATAQRYMALLPDLLWSSQLALASCDRPRLIKVIPGLLRTLREGLDSIDYPRSQTEAFFQALMGLHEAAYKTQRSDPDVQCPPGDPTASLLSETGMPAAEARDWGLMDDLNIDTQPAFLDTLPQGSDWQPSARYR